MFVYEHGYIKPNTERGVSDYAPLVLGSNKLNNVCGIDKIKNKVLLAVNGDIYVSGQIFAGNHKISQEIHATDKINMNYKKQKNELEAVKEQNATYYHVDPTESSSILYVSPINGPVYVVLGGKNGCVDFRSNQEITIKDTSLLHNDGASYNIYITVPNGNTAIEHYGADCKLKVSSPGTYVLNTSNGSVTFRHMAGNKPCWLIESQFIGNPRVLPNTGLRFNQINPNHIKNLLK